ncbi:MAG: hypothetical protein EON58_04010 [Alphaproteobacteria bacterium]|nr:MAG: hypothetical protein EON58_04010 [Alphaproteobacteria bacterium]
MKKTLLPLAGLMCCLVQNVNAQHAPLAYGRVGGSDQTADFWTGGSAYGSTFTAQRAHDLSTYSFGPYLVYAAPYTDTVLPYSSTASATFVGSSGVDFVQFQGQSYNGALYAPYVPYWGASARGVVWWGELKYNTTLPYSSTQNVTVRFYAPVEFQHFQGHVVNATGVSSPAYVHYPSLNVGGYVLGASIHGDQTLSYGQGSVTFGDGSPTLFTQRQNWAQAADFSFWYPLTGARGYVTRGLLSSTAQTVPFNASTSVTAAANSEITFTNLPTSSAYNADNYGWVAKVTLGANATLPKGAGGTPTNYYTGDVIDVTGPGTYTSTPTRYVSSSVPPR